MENNTNTNNNINLGEELQNRAKNQVLKAVDTNWSSFFTGRNVLIILAVLFALYILSGYNKLARAANEIDAQWAQVDSVLQRRFDSIDQAVGALKVSNKNELEAIKMITDARKIYTAASGDVPAQVAAVNNYNGALNGLLLSRGINGENYANLKTPELVGGLMGGTTIEGNENRINVERMRYNEKVQEFNTQISTFPGNVLAGWFGFSKKTYFEIADPAAKNAPKIAPNLDF
jgi:LemA protein